MKKYFIYVLICVTLLTIKVVSGRELNNLLIDKVIILDAGHGGKDKGTSYQGIFESDINLSIVLKLRDELIKQGCIVKLTRDENYDLSSPNISRRKKSDFDNRIKLINESNADMYLSIHINFLDNSKYYGSQVFYTKGNEELANKMQDSMKKNLKSPMGAKKLPNSIYMYKQLEVPGVLIECGFLSNKNERELLITDEYQDKIVKAIIDGLIAYY